MANDLVLHVMYAHTVRSRVYVSILLYTHSSIHPLLCICIQPFLGCYLHNVLVSLLQKLHDVYKRFVVLVHVHDYCDFNCDYEMFAVNRGS